MDFFARELISDEPVIYFYLTYEYHKEKEQYRKRDQNPEPLGDFLSCRIGHNKDKFKTKFGKLPSLWLTLQIEMANYL